MSEMVTDEMVEAACKTQWVPQTWYGMSEGGRDRQRDDMRKALTAALTARTPDTETPSSPESLNAARWCKLAAIVRDAGRERGGYVVLFGHDGIGDDAPCATIQIMDAFNNPHTTRWMSDGTTLDDAIDARAETHHV